MATNSEGADLYYLLALMQPLFCVRCLFSFMCWPHLKVQLLLNAKVVLTCRAFLIILLACSLMLGISGSEGFTSVVTSVGPTKLCWGSGQPKSSPGAARSVCIGQYVSEEPSTGWAGSWYISSGMLDVRMGVWIVDLMNSISGGARKLTTSAVWRYS